MDDAPSLYLSIIIPAYNEEKQPPQDVGRVRSVLDEALPVGSVESALGR